MPLISTLDTVQVYALKCLLLEEGVDLSPFWLAALAQSSTATALHLPKQKSQFLPLTNLDEDWAEELKHDLQEAISHLRHCHTAQSPLTKFYFKYFEVVLMSVIETAQSVDHVLLEELDKH